MGLGNGKDHWNFYVFRRQCSIMVKIVGTGRRLYSCFPLVNYISLVSLADYLPLSVPIYKVTIIFHPLSTVFKIKWNYPCQALNTMARAQQGLFINIIIIIIITMPGTISPMHHFIISSPPFLFLPCFYIRAGLWQSFSFHWYLIVSPQGGWTWRQHTAPHWNNSCFGKGSWMLRPRNFLSSSGRLKKYSGLRREVRQRAKWLFSYFSD